MDLALIFGVVILVALGMLVFAMYVGGGASAFRRQSGLLVLMALSLVAIGLLILVLARVQSGLPLLGIIIAGVGALIAALQARSISLQHAAPRPPPLAIAMWLIAGFFVVLAVAGAAMFLA